MATQHTQWYLQVWFTGNVPQQLIDLFGQPTNVIKAATIDSRPSVTQYAEWLCENEDHSQRLSNQVEALWNAGKLPNVADVGGGANYTPTTEEEKQQMYNAVSLVAASLCDAAREQLRCYQVMERDGSPADQVVSGMLWAMAGMLEPLTKFDKVVYELYDHICSIAADLIEHK